MLNTDFLKNEISYYNIPLISMGHIKILEMCVGTLGMCGCLLEGGDHFKICQTKVGAY